MKFLSIDQLEALTSFLTDREAGDRILNGRIEAFSWYVFTVRRQSLELSNSAPMGIYRNDSCLGYRYVVAPTYSRALTACKFLKCRCLPLLPVSTCEQFFFNAFYQQTRGGGQKVIQVAGTAICGRGRILS
jgi:hypothetical protein